MTVLPLSGSVIAAMEFRRLIVEEQAAITIVHSDRCAKIEALERYYAKPIDLKQAMNQELLTRRTWLI